LGLATTAMGRSEPPSTSPPARESGRFSYLSCNRQETTASGSTWLGVWVWVRAGVRAGVSVRVRVRPLRQHLREVLDA
jgi:hypothetical protein